MKTLESELQRIGVDIEVRRLTTTLVSLTIDSPARFNKHTRYYNTQDLMCIIKKIHKPISWNTFIKAISKVPYVD